MKANVREVWLAEFKPNKGEGVVSVHYNKEKAVDCLCTVARFMVLRNRYPEKLEKLQDRLMKMGRTYIKGYKLTVWSVCFIDYVEEVKVD